MLPVLGLPAPSSPSHLPHLHLQSLSCCQSTVPKFIRAVAAGYCVPGKIILDWLPSLLLLLWHADKMLIGPNAFDTRGETACSRHRASCHPFHRGTGWILPFACWRGADQGLLDLTEPRTGLHLPCGKQLKQCHLLADGYTKRNSAFLRTSGILLFAGGLWHRIGEISVRASQ